MSSIRGIHAYPSIEQSSGEVTTGSKLVGEAAGKLASMLEAIRENTQSLEAIARDT